MVGKGLHKLSIDLDHLGVIGLGKGGFLETFPLKVEGEGSVVFLHLLKKAPMSLMKVDLPQAKVKDRGKGMVGKLYNRLTELLLQSGAIPLV
jgi:hypothetical protein